MVFFSFALFFAMILADAGYAILLGLLLLWRWRGLGRSDVGLRFRRMGAAMLSASLLYGALAGSWFGITPESGSLVGAVHLLDMNDYDTMMRLSILIGCVHVGLANLEVARHASTWPERALPGGWIATILGGVMLWLGDASLLALFTGSALLTLGGILILGFGSQRPITSLRSGLLRLADGLIALTGVTKVFGDILSYLRLFALGLASGSLAFTFNQLAEQVHASIPGPGLLFSILILFLGHTINLGLGIVSGVVHGLRLNFIEFFNWAVREEGTPFHAFGKKETSP
ncbi:MAG: hypothetical protein HQL50_12560 [Magnetococcales bacterium]|nr:hypothetical protein [Magnetococcales bacterium]